MGLISKRTRLLGLPVGPKRPNWSGIAKLAAGAAAVVGAQQAGTRAKKAVGGAVGKGKTAVKAGKQVVETAKDVRDKAEGLTDSIAGPSTSFGKAAAALKEASSWGEDTDHDDNLKKQRLIISEQIDIGVPRRVVYNQWTQFEDFPAIFRGVESVEQRDDETVVWKGKILASKRRWTARIVEQVPDERIKWVTKGGADHLGVVTFHELDADLTRVMLEMEYFPQGLVERFGNLFLAARHRVRKDLRLFKHFVELQGEATGAWRGEIDASDEHDDSEAAASTDDAASDDAASDDAEREAADEDGGGPQRDERGRFVAQDDDAEDATAEEPSEAKG